jgi:tetratricopeptide (TPR) repeat protein
MKRESKDPINRAQAEDWADRILVYCTVAQTYDKDLAKSWFFLGKYYQLRGQEEKADKHFKHAVRLDPTYADAVALTEMVGSAAIPRWAVIGPFNNPGGATDDIQHPIETEGVDLHKKYLGQAGTIAWRKVEMPAKTPVLAEHVVDFNQLFGTRENAAAYAVTWIESDKATNAVLALGSDDGVMVWLNDKQVHKNLVARVYAAQSDRVPIRLLQGPNKLVVKITQGTGGWCFGAQLLRSNGEFLTGMKCSAVPISAHEAR